MPSLDPDIYRDLLDALPVGIYIVGLDRRIHFWNKEAEHITGYPAHEVIGRSCGADVLVHCGAEGTPVCSTGECLLACALRDRQPREALLFARHKDGHRVPVFVHSIPLCSEEGKVHNIAEVFQQQGASLPMQVHGAGHDSNDGLNIPSLSATEAYLQSRLNSGGNTATFILELEGVQEMARQRGREMVNASMRALVNTVADLLPMPHFLGRWRDQSFLIVVPGATEQVFGELLGQLRGLGNSLTVLWWGDRVASHANVRGVLIREPEQLQALLIRTEAR
jgi:PAS domain S-box-containing protein